MAFTPENSAIKVTPEVEEKMKSLVSADEIKAYLASVAVDQKLVRRDIYSPDVLIPTAPATAPRAFGKTIVVNGVKHVLQAATEQELVAAETAFYREQFSNNSSTTETREIPRDAETGRFTRPDDPVAKAELDLKFKRGEISTADYLAQSGAVDDYLKSQGVPIDELKASVEEKRSKNFTSNWEAATAEFKERHPDYVGGADNLAEFSRTLQALNLVDHPSLDSLEAAFADMVRREAYYKNPEVTAYEEQQKALKSATSVEEIRSIVRPSGSSLFGR